MRVVYEDQLPPDMSDAEYAEWFSRSWVDGVRIGPAPGDRCKCSANAL
jgi:hypothetical protein